MQNKDSSVTEMDSYMQALVCAECPILPQRLAMCLDACDMHMHMHMHMHMYNMCMLHLSLIHI